MARRPLDNTGAVNSFLELPLNQGFVDHDIPRSYFRGSNRILQWKSLEHRTRFSKSTFTNDYIRVQLKINWNRSHYFYGVYPPAPEFWTNWLTISLLHPIGEDSFPCRREFGFIGSKFSTDSAGFVIRLRRDTVKRPSAVAKLSPSGALLMSTFIGGGSDDNSDGIYADASGNVFFTGVTGSTDFPVTPNAYQSALAGDHDAVLVRLSADFSRLLYSTYMGGGNYDNGRSAYLHQDGSLYITGSVNGGGWPTWNAHQDFFAGGGGGSTVGYAGDNILAKFAPTPIGLLRDDSIGSIAPGSFDLTAILPLVNPDDLHIPAISPGDAETEPVIGDRARPLIFYSLTNDATLLLVKSPPDLLFFF